MTRMSQFDEKTKRSLRDTRDAAGCSVYISTAIAALSCVWANHPPADGRPAGPSRPRLLIAFASLRERPAFSSLFLYRHDGVGAGEIAGSIPPLAERADSHPALTSDGTVCLYAS